MHCHSKSLDPASLANLDASIQKDIDDGRMFGASVLVARGGEIGHCRAFGTVAPGRETARDDKFLMVSLTKSFTAARVLAAIDEGRFTLDTRVSEIVTEFASGGKHKATIRMLLNHTAGAYGAIPAPSPLAADAVGELEPYVAAVSRVPAAFTPGTRASYSSFAGYAILGQILVLTDPKGRSYTDIMEQDVFQPLGMSDSGIGVEPADPRRVLVSHTQATPQNAYTAQFLNSRTVRGCEIPAANAYATIDDVFAFTEVIRNGGRAANGHRLISPALFDYAARNHTGDLDNDAWVSELDAAGLSRFRANFSLLGGYCRDDGHFLTGCGFTASPRALCAIGGGSTLWMVDPERDLTFIFLSAGFIEGLAHAQRLSRLSDLALAACD